MVFFKIRKKNTNKFVHKSGASMHNTNSFYHSHEWDNLEGIKKSLKYYLSKGKKNSVNLRNQAANLRQEATKARQNPQPTSHRYSWMLERAAILDKKADQNDAKIDSFMNDFEVVKYEIVTREILSLEEASNIKPTPKPVVAPSVEEDIIDGI